MSTVFDVTHNCYPLQMGFPIQHIIKLFIQAKASLVGCVFVILQGLSNFSYTHTKMHPEVLFSKNVSF